MPRRRRPATYETAPPPAPGRCLLPIDEKPIRREALRKCRRALTQRSKAQQELEAFQERDRPAYQRWIYTSFGAMMSEARASEERIFELRDLFEEVQAEAFLLGVSDEEAYLRVKERRARREAGEESAASDGKPDDDPAGEEDEEDDEEEAEFEAAFRERFRQQFGSDPEEYAEEMHRRRLEELSGKGSKDAAGGDVKNLYRKLVRKLHPDMHGEVEEKKKELWHAVQEAYRRGDYGRLQELYAQCEEESEEAIGPQTPVSRVLAVWENARSALRTIRSEIRRARQDPAWNFTRKKPREQERMGKEIRDSLEWQLEQQRELLEDLEEQVQLWEKAARRREARQERSAPQRRRRRPTASGSWQAEFSF